MLRILVYGGCGFIGSYLVDRLLQRSDLSEVLVVDNVWTGLEESLDHNRDPRLRIVVEDDERAKLDGQFDEI